MKISGFTIVKNAGKLHYPIRESILSILPIVDEYIIALGECDQGDNTRQIINEINSPKIKIIDTVWDVKQYPKGSVLAQQTDLAKSHCTGDWLFYLQADEVVHEKDHPAIVNACNMYLNDKNVEGFLFKYIHFWGDYQHAFTENHAWYRNEIRIIRNLPDIHSWRDAQSFRVITNFTKDKYLTKDSSRKLNVKWVKTYIYHYGWVRPPKIMSKKQTHFTNCYEDESSQLQELEVYSEVDFGPLGTIPQFKMTHPLVMSDLISRFNWGKDLNYSLLKVKGTRTHKHNRIVYKILSFLENTFSPRGIFNFKNYKLLK